MRLVILPVLLLFSSLSLNAQQLAEWYRVYTFDDSVIEMNTSLVTFISEDVARVRFRWTFDQPEALSEEPKSKYKSRLEVMEVNCSLQRYRPYHFTFYDATGNIIRIHDVPGEWQAIASGSMMAKLFVPACELVKKKTHAEVVSSEEIRLQKAAKYAYAFAQQLEQAKDFNSVIDKFFVPNFLTGYLSDKQTKWFLNLDPNTRGEAEPRRTTAILRGFDERWVSQLFVCDQSMSFCLRRTRSKLEKIVRQMFCV